MPRKKREKKEYNYIIYGIVLVLVAIIGLGGFGIVGRGIAVLAAFLVGSWYQVLLLLTLAIGINTIFKGEFLKIFQRKLIGLYLILISILILSHLNYVIDQGITGFSIITEIFRNFELTIDAEIKGGGIVGATITASLLPLLDQIGVQIVTYTLLILGIIILVGSNLKAIFYKSKEVGQNIFKKEVKEAVDAAEKEFEKDGKIIISSVDELKKPVEEEPEEEPEISKGYRKPSITILNKPEKINHTENQDFAKQNIKILEKVFNDFGISGKVVAVNIGPSVTQYEIELKAGTKVSKVTSINREISLALAAKDVRIQAPIPGKSTVGIEIPNKVPSYVTIREILEQAPKELRDNKLLVALGKDLMGQPVYCEINKTPHLLIAGATGSGKSVCINSIIVSILMRAKPEEVKLILIDPKKVELNNYNHMPHLVTEVVINPKQANIALKNLVKEMERRYELFNQSNTKNIAGYNAYLEKTNQHKDKIPYIVVIIDELADLMLVAAKEVEDSIMRITQLARAAGIHLIVATQRPSTDVITGLIKSNIPSRISFAVSSSIDSRTILDMMGAEKLLGNGDMLFIPMGATAPIRVQGTIISEKEIKTVVDHVKNQQKAQYDETFLIEENQKEEKLAIEEDEYEDPMYDEIVEFVIEQQKASASLLQRKFRLGYNRAARVIDLLEERGIIGPARGSKPREVLIQLKKE